jgi:hypothetical protein
MDRDDDLKKTLKIFVLFHGIPCGPRFTLIRAQGLKREAGIRCNR